MSESSDAPSARSAPTTVVRDGLITGVAVDYFDATATRVPGFGSIYESVRQTFDVVLSSDPEFATRPKRPVEDERKRSTDPEGSRPAGEAGRPPEARDDTDGRPAEPGDERVAER